MRERREVVRAEGGHEPREVICEELRARALDGRVGVCGRIGKRDRYDERCRFEGCAVAAIARVPCGEREEEDRGTDEKKARHASHATGGGTQRDLDLVGEACEGEVHPCLIDLDAHMVQIPRIRSRTCPPRRTGPVDHHETQASGDARVASLPREPASAENVGAVLSAWEI
jgi:hypothetical protein